MIRTDSAKACVLKWMQENPNACKHKLGTEIARAAGESCNFGDATLQLALSSLIKRGVVYRSDADRGFDYRINYWHKDTPAFILDNAPVDIQKKMKEKLNKMTDDQYLDDEGCITTPNAVEKVAVDPFNEIDFSENKETVEHRTDVYPEGSFYNPIEPEKDPWEEDTATVPLKITKSDDGKQITVNLSLVINL